MDRSPPGSVHAAPGLPQLQARAYFALADATPRVLLLPRRCSLFDLGCLDRGFVLLDRLVQQLPLAPARKYHQVNEGKKRLNALRRL